MRYSTLILLAATLVVAPASAQTRVGDFLHMPGTDAITDRDLSYVSTVAEGNNGDARLVWRCSGPTIALALAAPELTGLSGPIPMRWRFDQDPASDRESWRASSLETLAYAPEGTIYPFSEIATEASSVVIRAEDDQGRTHDYRFSLDGLNNALNRLDCARHLEVLGNRRLMALFDKAAIDSGRALEQGGISRLIEEFPFVGHRVQRRYTASSESCWQTHWTVGDVVFFASEQDAREGGYARGEGC